MMTFKLFHTAFAALVALATIANQSPASAQTGPGGTIIAPHRNGFGIYGDPSGQDNETSDNTSPTTITTSQGEIIRITPTGIISDRRGYIGKINPDGTIMSDHGYVGRVTPYNGQSDSSAARTQAALMLLHVTP